MNGYDFRIYTRNAQTSIRKGNRSLTLSQLKAGDQVHVRGVFVVVDGETHVFAHEIKLQDEEDLASLYGVLENEIIPLYYKRREGDNLPVEWVRRIKESIRTIAPYVTAKRMLKEYVEGYYLPVMRRRQG